MNNEVNNLEDVIDSRDILERTEELTERLIEQHEESGGQQNEFEAWLQGQAATGDEEAQELLTLKKLATECEGYGDWEYGETLIRDSYFEEYAQQLAEDCGMINRDATWPNSCIDWEQAARELQMDYMSIDFDGVQYWMRA